MARYCPNLSSEATSARPFLFLSYNTSTFTESGSVQKTSLWNLTCDFSDPTGLGRRDDRSALQGPQRLAGSRAEGHQDVSKKKEREAGDLVCIGGRCAIRTVDGVISLRKPLKEDGCIICLSATRGYASGVLRYSFFLGYILLSLVCSLS